MKRAKRTPEQMLAEFHRLADCYDCLGVCVYLGYEEPTRMGGHRQPPLDRDSVLAGVESCASSMAEVLAGMTQALNDLSLGMADMLRYDPARAKSVLGKYRIASGRDFFNDVGQPRRLVVALLRSKRLQEDTEFQLLNAALCDPGTPMLTPSQRERANQMIADFESRTALHI